MEPLFPRFAGFASRRRTVVWLSTVVLCAATASVGTNVAAASTDGGTRVATTWTTMGGGPMITCAGGGTCPKEMVGVTDSVGQPVILGTVDGGVRWSAQPDPSGTYELNDVACPSTTQCEAVGYKYVGSAEPFPPVDEDILRTTTGGKAWSSTTPSDRLGKFLGLSCPGVTVCEVVGYSGHADSLPPDVAGVAATTVDGKLTRQVTVPGLAHGELTSVSCASAEICDAVGTIYVGGNDSFNGVDYTTSDGGAEWTARSLPPDPAGTGTYIGVMSGVSCSSPMVCVAVGQWSSVAGHGEPDFGGVALSSTDGGVKWSVDTVPSHLADLRSLHCAASIGCVAVGEVAIIGPHSESTGNGTAIKASTEAGGAWRQETVPAGSYSLSGLSCVLTQCTAVGATSKDGDEIIVSTNGGTTWSSQAAPAATNDGLSAVRCASKLVCEAVG